MTRNELNKVANNNWVISRGEACLHAKHLPTIKNIEAKYGKGLITQIWMERPNINGYGRCKFEVAYSISSLNILENKSRREVIADELRTLMSKDLPSEFEKATGSTVIATRIQLPEDRSDEEQNKSGVFKIIKFYRFLDAKLNEWNNGDSLKLL